MIVSVRGAVRATEPDAAVVEVGGVGLRVLCGPGVLAGLRVGQEAELATSLVVREDSLTLFGFVDAEARALFELLQTASGVGPKVAAAVLAVLTPEQLRRALLAEDLVTLTKVPGIGRKGAQRLVVELKDRVLEVPSASPVLPGAPEPAPRPDDVWRTRLHGALTGLGFPSSDADAAVDAAAEADLPRTAGDEVDVSALLRGAVQALGRAAR